MNYRKINWNYVVSKPETYPTGLRPAFKIETTYYIIDTNGDVTPKIGYAWDGSTWAIDTKESMNASLVHDICCQATQDGLLHRRWKAQSDREYWKLCVKDGMFIGRATLRYLVIQFHDWENTPPNFTEYTV